MNFTVSKYLFLSTLTLSTPVFASDYLQEVVVTVSKVETPLRELGSSVSVISKDDIELKGYQSIAEVLRSQAGVSVSNSGGQGKSTAIRIRGEEGFRTLILIDGLDVSDPSTPQVGPRSEHLMTSGEIERVEVLRGPQGFIYGADAGGVINILTQSAEEGANGELSLENGRYQSRKVSTYVAASNAVGGALVSISDFQTDGFDLSETKAINPLEEDGYQNTTIHSKFFINVNEFVKTQLVIRDTSSENEYDGYGSDNALGHFDQTAGRLSLSYADEALQHQVAVQYSETESQHYEDNGFVYGSEGSSHKVEYLGGINKEESVFSAVWGTDFESEELIYDGKVYGRDQFAVFSELRGAYKKAFFGSLGVRYDDSDQFGDHVSLRLSLAHVRDVSEGVTIKYRTSMGSGFRAPSPSEIGLNERSTVEGLLPLAEESSVGFDLGLDLSVGESFLAQLTYFNQTIDDLISYEYSVEAGDGAYYQHLGVSDSKGIECNADWSVSSNVNLVASYTYNESLTPEDTQRVRRPKKFGNAGVQLSFLEGTLKALLSARFIKESIDLGGAPLDDYNVLDASVVYQLEDNITLSARIENLADKHYQEVTGYDAAEAAFYFGIKTRF